MEKNYFNRLSFISFIDSVIIYHIIRRRLCFKVIRVFKSERCCNYSWAIWSIIILQLKTFISHRSEYVHQILVRIIHSLCHHPSYILTRNLGFRVSRIFKYKLNRNYSQVVWSSITSLFEKFGPGEQNLLTIHCFEVFIYHPNFYAIFTGNCCFSMSRIFE